jgi:hypothetical protein
VADMSVELEEFMPGRFRVKKDRCPHCRSDLPMPMVISDTMDPVEQVDGKYYTSKRQYRAVGRAHGLVEVGNEKLPPRVRASADRNIKATRRRSIHTAIQKYKAGVRSF